MEYGAIDLHTQHSEIRIVTAEGEAVVAERIATTPAALARLFATRAPLRVLVETGTESEWVAQQLERYGHEVIVADPNYAPMYGERSRRVKTDRRDVAALAEANRRGWYRRARRASAAQRQVRRLLLTRAALIRSRTQAINVIRAVVRGTGARVPSGQAETFARRVRALELSADVVIAVAPLLTLLEAIAEPIAAATAVVEQQAAADPVAHLLTTAPGVGPVTALHFRATLDTVTRFDDAGAVTAYLGLVPSERSSGDRRQRGGITKAGARETRAMLVQASWTVWRIRRGAGAELARWAHRLAARRGKPVAIVALARRLARVLFAMWRDQRPFVERARPAAAA